MSFSSAYWRLEVVKILRRCDSSIFARQKTRPATRIARVAGPHIVLVVNPTEVARHVRDFVDELGA
jgi:hypothetical protein